MMNIFKNAVITAICGAVLAGCASSASQQAQRPQPSGDAIPNTATAGSCDTSEKTSLDLWAEGSTRFDAKNIFVRRTAAGAQMSLCDVLRATGKKVTIFQFAGVDCIECQEKSSFLTKKVGAGEYKDVALVLVNTDKFEDFTDADAKGYINKWAPNAYLVRDNARLWKALSEDPTLPTRATIMAMNRNMEAVVLNKTGTSKQKILDEAVKLIVKKD